MQQILKSDIPDRSRQRISLLVVDGVELWLLLVGAMLLAVQFRLQVPLGQPLMVEYVPLPLPIWGLLALSVVVGVGASSAAWVSRSAAAVILGDAHPFRRFLAILALAALLVLVLLPDVSQLQVLYFAIGGVLIAALCIALPRRLYPSFSSRVIFRSFAAVWERRSLLFIWLSFNIQTRYSQRLLGMLWIILLPIATSLVLAIAFSQFMRIQINTPFIAFYMSALVPYNFFANILYGSANAVITRSTIITQVYFPREILILLLVGESLVDFVFGFIAMLIINLLTGIVPNGLFIYLPLLFLILLTMAMGIAFALSALTVVVRDIPQLLAVVLQLVFFMTPVIYPIEQFPERFRFLFVLNPIAPVVQGFRDIIAFNRPPDLVSLAFPLVFAATAFTVGFAIFKAFETEMTDLL
ncbi:MAG: ABC transporter permease [Anaerolineae bacterium]